ncbi:MAG: condensation domain-containing protein, partial [bacterium]|nr:condensation domain-containing protein [bacterium]
NIAEIVLIKDKLDFISLERAINLIIQDNDGLRLKITEVDGQPCQYVSKYNYSNIQFYDFSQTGGFEALYNWDEYKNGSCFELLDSDLFYFVIFKIDENNCGFYIKTHHFISDAWTIANLLISGIVEYYCLLKSNKTSSMRINPSYLDYISSENAYKETSNFEENKKFWEDEFKTIPEVMSLKPSLSYYKDTKAKRKTFILSKELTMQIFKYCKLTNNSPFTVFLSSLSILIHKYTSNNDIVIGTPILNRSNQREKETVGMYISTVLVRLNVDIEISFIKYIDYVSKQWKQILNNQKYPYDLIHKDFKERQKVNENLYDVVLSFQNAKHKKTKIEYSTEWVFTG